MDILARKLGNSAHKWLVYQEAIQEESGVNNKLRENSFFEKSV